VKIGRGELPSAAPKALAVKASKPDSRTTPSAAAMTSSFVNLAEGGITFLLSKTYVLKLLFLIIRSRPSIVKNKKTGDVWKGLAAGMIF
jgi:hypothetical protein